VANETVFDVRAIPQWERHARIFAAFDALDEESVLLIVSDHEPRPLRAQFEELYAGRFQWEQKEHGDGRWEARLVRCRDASDDRDVFALLRRTAVFRDCSDRALSELAYRARRSSVRRDRAVAEQGTLWPYVGIVRTGIVSAVLATASGREQGLYDVLPGEIFGEVALLDRGYLAMRFVAMTAGTVVVMLPAELVRALCARDRGVAARLEAIAAQRVRKILDRFGSNLARSATACVANVLLSYAAPSIGLERALEPLPRLTQNELALSAGTVKEVVSRALAELEETGALVREGGHIVQLDRAKLADAAAGR
jgi:CRP/FNR family cyclic AMP-dependent transcriptional regulator